MIGILFFGISCHSLYASLEQISRQDSEIKKAEEKANLAKCNIIRTLLSTPTRAPQNSTPQKTDYNSMQQVLIFPHSGYLNQSICPDASLKSIKVQNAYIAPKDYDEFPSRR